MAEARLVDEPGGLRRATGAADDDAGSLQPRDLAHQRTDGASRRRDEHGLVGLRARDLEEADVGGESRHAPHPQVALRRRPLAVDLLHAVGRDDHPLSPSVAVQHGVTGRKVMDGGADVLDDTHRPAVHRCVQLEGRDVRLAVVHAAPHVGIHAQPGVADDDVVRARFGQVHLDQAEVVVRRLPVGSTDEVPLTRADHGPASPALAGGAVHLLGRRAAEWPVRRRC
jgi:hypothetical protein